MNEELNTKLAKWAGFKLIENPTAWVKWAYLDPSGSLYSFEGFPHLTQSLDACFRWLVPKIIESGDYSIVITQNLARCVGYVRPLQSGRQYDATDNQIPVLALCKAIEKLIDEEKS